MGLRKQLLLLSIIAILGGFTGCHVAPGYLSSNPSGVDTIPQTFENPVGLPEIPKKTQEDIPTPAKKENSDPTSASPKKDELKNPDEVADLKKMPLKLPEASSFIKNAEWVMIHEGKKIGTPCNLYLIRVLGVSGFPQEFFLANDFDHYAKKYFKHVQVTEFKNDHSGSDIARLKRHLWSFPERTPFILQWTGSGIAMHGHIAIVERVHDQLVIYQANLNRYTARKDQTTVQNLLNGFNRRTLTVYAEFKN